GAPVAARAGEVLARIHARAGGLIVIISVGGVETPEDVWDRITHGAHLVQTYSGFIFAGTELIRGANRLVARRLRQGGFSSIDEAVGAATRCEPARRGLLIDQPGQRAPRHALS